MFRFVKNPDPRKKPPYGSRLDPTHPLAQRQLGCWLLNEGGGNYVYDIAANGVKGALSNVSWLNGKLVNSSNSGIVNFGNILDSLNQLTILVKVKYDSSGGGTYRYILGKHYTAFLMYTSSDGKLGVSMQTDSNSVDTTSWTYDTHVLEERDTTVIYTWDNSYIRLYIDGEYEDYISLSGSNIASNTYSLVFFNREDDLERSFWGEIDFAGIWKRALTDSETAQLYAEPYCSILVPRYWYMVDFGAGASSSSSSTSSSSSSSSSSTSSSTSSSNSSSSSSSSSSTSSSNSPAQVPVPVRVLHLSQYRLAQVYRAVHRVPAVRSRFHQALVAPVRATVHLAAVIVFQAQALPIH